MLEEAGCDLLWMPSVERHLPATASRPRSASPACRERWEGEARPGHFDGVATVVAKLLLVGPARCRAVRRKGFSAARGDPADGRRSRTFPSRSSACRRFASRTASRSRRATPICRADERQQAVALPRALERRARGDPRRHAGRRGASRSASESLRDGGFLADRLFRAGRRGDARAARRSQQAKCA